MRKQLALDKHLNMVDVASASAVQLGLTSQVEGTPLVNQISVCHSTLVERMAEERDAPARLSSADMAETLDLDRSTARQIIDSGQRVTVREAMAVTREVAMSGGLCAMDGLK